MKKILIGISSLFSFIVVFCCVVILLYSNGIKAVSGDSSLVEFEVIEGNNYYNIASDLKSAGLIKSEFWYKVYIKLNDTPNIQIGVYKLSKNMSVSEIINQLSYSSYNPNSVTITFKEGYNFDDIIDQIEKNTNNNKDDVIALLNDNSYIDSLIEKYWFISDEIKNENIYYALEGYLYPNTYQFKNKDVSVEEIFSALLNETEKKLSLYRDKINESSYTIHQLLTLASIVELEGVNSEDRTKIAGVFYNRLNSNMNLGSDVTTYYGARVKMSERDLYVSELQDNNGYNTRSSSMAGKLPIGPICNPSIDSIKAVLYPEESDYYYFIADKNKKTYFTKSSVEHLAKKNELIEAGLWYTYD